jgi:hypothetical protein
MIRPTAVVIPFTAALWFAFGSPVAAQVEWQIDSTTSIGGNDVTLVRGNPTVVDTPFGSGLEFDGDDGIIVNDNPIFAAASFTMEMIFRPDPIVNATSNEPRIFHVQSVPAPPDHRAILEGRITGDNQSWYPDVFLQTQATLPGNPNNLALIDASKTRPLGEWYHYAMTYNGSLLKAFINGELVLSGAVALQSMADGQTSLGMRQNQRNFFEGVIAKVRFTTSALDPAQFLTVQLPGDYDGNYIVDAADYDEWKNAFGQSVAAPGDGADGNRNGIVDAADYTVWRDHLDSSGSAALAASVPEPATIVMFAAGGAGLAFTRQWLSFRPLRRTTSAAHVVISMTTLDGSGTVDLLKAPLPPGVVAPKLFFQAR